MTQSLNTHLQTACIRICWISERKHQVSLGNSCRHLISYRNTSPYFIWQKMFVNPKVWILGIPVMWWSRSGVQTSRSDIPGTAGYSPRGNRANWRHGVPDDSVRLVLTKLCVRIPITYYLDRSLLSESLFTPDEKVQRLTHKEGVPVFAGWIFMTSFMSETLIKISEIWSFMAVKIWIVFLGVKLAVIKWLKTMY